MQCRICLETDNVDMLAPCACRGTAMYIHRRCLDEHTRYYPDRICSVCNTRMRREATVSEMWGMAVLAIMVTLLMYVSSAHILTKICVVMSLGLILTGFSLQDCVTHDVVGLALFVGIACLSATQVFPPVIIMIVSGALYTLAMYIPVLYLLILASVCLLSLYLAVFMASLAGHLDHYTSTLVFITLTLFWYGWIKLHPPMRLAAE